MKIVYLKGKLLLLVIIFNWLSSNHIFAQQQPNQWKPPFKYYTPSYDNQRLMTGIGFLEQHPTFYVLPADRFGAVKPSEFNGVEIDIDFDIDLSMRRRLFSFSNQAAGLNNKYLDIYYQNNSMVFRRYLNATTYYDYVILDKLFDPARGKYWEVSLYFTGTFFWIQTRSKTYSTDGTYLTPMYYGVNILNDYNMTNILAHSSDSKILIGDADDSHIHIASIEAYYFNYTELKNDIQSRFSNITPYATIKAAAVETADDH